jgi:hypothetical protein
LLAVVKDSSGRAKFVGDFESGLTERSSIPSAAISVYPPSLAIDLDLLFPSLF